MRRAPKTPLPTKAIKEATGPSLSGASTLTYHIGIDEKKHLCFRIVGNTNGGLFSSEWVAWETLAKAIDTDQPITAGLLKRSGVCQGKSANTPGFLAAALKAEGLLEPREDGGYQKADPAAWLTAMQALIEAGAEVPRQKR